MVQPSAILRQLPRFANFLRLCQHGGDLHGGSQVGCVQMIAAFVHHPFSFGHHVKERFAGIHCRITLGPISPSNVIAN